MPTYVYACDDCGAQFEQFQRFSDAPLTQCPRCEGGVRRVFQPVGIVFKGTGWYITDSRKRSNGSGASEAKSASSDDTKTKTSETTSETSTSAKAA
ncbi:MAG: hypothetical protein KatS3mg057_0022 [Herpetosiphonaceae bacterium]|nr:MAG: hypothetical protein KatS3mg057_0022 [Herpetosiphonaceae bacterium]